MKTCKDCPHFNVCDSFGVFMPKEIKSTFDQARLDLINNKWKNCKFKNDELRFLEVPCKVGTELFLSDYPMHHHRLKEYKFIGNRVVMVIECFEFQRTCKRFVDEHFGKTVFLTKEAMLKELNKECD